MTQTETIRNVPARRPARNPLDAIIYAIASRFGDKAIEVERFLRFAFVGSIGALIDAGTLALLQATILPPTLREPIDYNVLIAQTIAFIAALISNFIWNRYWTYPDSRSRKIHHQLFQFGLISLIGWVGRSIWIVSVHQFLGQTLMPVLLPVIHLIKPHYIPSEVGQAKLGTMAAWLVGVVVVMVWNFIANRLWTYNDVSSGVQA
jgi:putative flippase GtrA